MATPSDEVMKTLTLADFYKIEVYESQWTDIFRRKRQTTVADVEAWAKRLRSVSAAGRAWIVDEKCKRLSIGRHEGVYYFDVK